MKDNCSLFALEETQETLHYLFKHVTQDENNAEVFKCCSTAFPSLGKFSEARRTVDREKRKVIRMLLFKMRSPITKEKQM
jgi:hypothetical protein